jgi:hypothetical protein
VFLSFEKRSKLSKKSGLQKEERRRIAREIKREIKQFDEIQMNEMQFYVNENNNPNRKLIFRFAIFFDSEVNFSLNAKDFNSSTNSSKSMNRFMFE